MENEFSQGQESVYSTKVRAGKRRTYFFDVRKTKGEDYYITLTESTRRFNGQGYNRHKIFLYKEDFNRFLEGLSDAVDHVKTVLNPDYDYEQFDRRQEEWEKKKLEEEAMAATSEEKDVSTDDTTSSEEETDADADDTNTDDKGIESEEDMTW